MKPTPTHLLPSIAVALVGAMWGVFWMPLRWFEDHFIGGGVVSAVFSATCLLAPLPWLLKRQSWNGLRSELLTGLLLGCGFSLYTVSLVLTDVINAILLFYLSPVWSTLAAWALQGQRLTLNRISAVTTGFLGIGLILGSSSGIPFPNGIGDWLALASGMLWSAGTMRSFANPHPGIALPVFCFAFGGLASSLLIVMFGTGSLAALSDMSGLAAYWGWVVVLALVIFVPPNFLVLWAAQRIDSGRVGILLMTECWWEASRLPCFRMRVSEFCKPSARF